MFTVSLLIVSSSLAAPAPGDSAKKALDELQGTWIAVAWEESGEKVPAEKVKEAGIAITIKGNELTLLPGKRDEGRFSFTLGPSKKPAHLNLQELGKEARPGVAHAIYSLEKGELKICVSNKFEPNKEEERPREFATGPSEMRPPKGGIMLTLKQEKK
jgi:uncharacterized protein (TIGR03067 family)